MRLSLFTPIPQLAMVCALMGSSFFLMVATRYGVPVSTTHSIIGAVLGVGVAAYGPPAINWEYSSGRGFAGIVASWFISIAGSGVMAAAAYLVMKYGVMRYRNSFARALVFAPIMFGFTYGIFSLTLVWKGTPKLKVRSACWRANNFQRPLLLPPTHSLTLSLATARHCSWTRSATHP